MKALTLFFILSSSVYAQGSFLSKKEAAEINDYLDSICPDTYCGGDLNFRPFGINCKANSCTVEFGASGAGNDLFDMDRSNSSLNQMMISQDDQDVKLTINDVLFETIDADDFGIAVYASFNFTCKLTNLANRLEGFESKRDLFYDMVVFGCINQLERTVYARQL